MSIRVKMYCDGVYAQAWGGVKALFRSSHEFKEGYLPTLEKDPNAIFEFQIDNQDVASQIVIGKKYYFDITPIPEN